MVTCLLTLDGVVTFTCLVTLDGVVTLTCLLTLDGMMTLTRLLTLDGMTTLTRLLTLDGVTTLTRLLPPGYGGRGAARLRAADGRRPAGAQSAPHGQPAPVAGRRGGPARLPVQLRHAAAEGAARHAHSQVRRAATRLSQEQDRCR